MALLGEDWGAWIPGNERPTKMDGTALRVVRAGIVPGTDVFEAYAIGLDGKPHGSPARFTEHVTEPSPGTLVAVVGADLSGRPGPGPGLTAPGPGTLLYPYSVIAASDGSLYLSSDYQIFRLRADGALEWVAGQTQYCVDPGDGDLDHACLQPVVMALDEKASILYLVEANPYRVRALDLGARTVRLIAGGASMPAVPGQPARLARFDALTGLAADGAGKVYLADQFQGLFRLDLATGTFDSFLADDACDGAPLTGATAVAVRNGTVFVSSYRCGPSVARIGADGTLETLAMASANSIAADGVGGVYFVTPQTVEHWDPASGDSTLVVDESPSILLGLAYTAAGRLAMVKQSTPQLFELW